MAYIDQPYQNSIAYHSVIGASFNQLLNRKPYASLAIAFHEKEGNAGQVEFFKSELALIETRLTMLAPDKGQAAVVKGNLGFAPCG